jgi:hypothetical protein
MMSSGGPHARFTCQSAGHASCNKLRTEHTRGAATIPIRYLRTTAWTASETSSEATKYSRTPYMVVILGGLVCCAVDNHASQCTMVPKNR